MNPNPLAPGYEEFKPVWVGNAAANRFSRCSGRVMPRGTSRIGRIRPGNDGSRWGMKFLESVAGPGKKGWEGAGAAAIHACKMMGG